jgi:cephalosporin hydroxylase
MSIGTYYQARALPSHAYTVYQRVETVKGFFGIDDATHFSLVLGLQNVTMPPADILEIGTYFGRSAGFLAQYIRPGERLHVCDAYTRETEDGYLDRPTVEIFLRNVETISPGTDPSQIVIHDCLSNDLVLPRDAAFRFVHVDGGHSIEQCSADLKLVAPHVVVGGVIVCDDYKHHRWPGVTQAVDDFLAGNPDFRLAASVNRRQASGQKVYIARHA